VCVRVYIYIYIYTHTHTQQLVRVVLFSLLSVGLVDMLFIPRMYRDAWSTKHKK